MGVTANKPGVCTTVQDGGRRGYMGSGFSPSGVMDQRAYHIGNILLDNPVNAPALEFCLAGPTLRFTTSTIIAITGGDFHPMLDGRPVASYTAVPVKHGSVLSFSAPRTGVYGYLAVAGGSFRIEKVMGSYSTNLKCGIGGYKGRKLQTGDYVPFVTKAVDYLPHLGSRTLPRSEAFPCEDADEITLRAVPGPQDDLFTDEGIRTFYEQPYTVTSKCDRMGFRLEGPVITTKQGSDIISDGIALGAVQVPDHGQPIVMLADRQTTGGYAKIATVASVDIPLLVQSKPGRVIRFERITVEEAQELYRAEHRSMMAWMQRVNRPSYGDVSPRKTARRLTPILEEQARMSKQSNEQNWTQTNRYLHADRRAAIADRLRKEADLARTIINAAEGGDGPSPGPRP